MFYASNFEMLLFIDFPTQNISSVGELISFGVYRISKSIRNNKKDERKNSASCEDASSIIHLRLRIHNEVREREKVERYGVGRRVRIEN